MKKGWLISAAGGRPRQMHRLEGGVFLEEEQSRDTGKMKPGFGRGLGGGGQGSERSRQAWGREDEMGSRGTERC